MMCLIVKNTKQLVQTELQLNDNIDLLLLAELISYKQHLRSLIIHSYQSSIRSLLAQRHFVILLQQTIS